jgi:hypothetical protein
MLTLEFEFRKVYVTVTICLNFDNLNTPIYMLFCPTCANLLVISSETGYNKWACNSCPYEFPISKQVCARIILKLCRSPLYDHFIDDFSLAYEAQGSRRCARRRGDVARC